MANVRIVLNRRGVRDLLRSRDVLRDLERRGNAIARAAGAGHRVESEIGPNRARVAVITDTTEAVISEATDRTLTRAFDAARDPNAPRIDTRRRDAQGRFLKAGE